MFAKSHLTSRALFFLFLHTIILRYRWLSVSEVGTLRCAASTQFPMRRRLWFLLSGVNIRGAIFCYGGAGIPVIPVIQRRVPVLSGRSSERRDTFLLTMPDMPLHEALLSLRGTTH